MDRTLCHARISHARITAVNVNADDSLTIDAALLDAAGIVAYERVHVINSDTGARLETYAVPGKSDSGQLCLNGPASRVGGVGDVVIISAFAQFGPEEARGFAPRVIKVDSQNHRISD